MIFFDFILPILLGFFVIYKSIMAIDKIDIVKKKGIKTRAKVIKIREEKIKNDFGDEDTGGYLINHSEVNYFFTVTFNDKNGRIIEKELEFPTTKNPNRNPPFDRDIIYLINENKSIDIILENNKGRGFTLYFILLIGFIFLFFAAYNYDGQIDIILEFIKNLFK